MFKFILKEKVQRFILGVIIFNSITLGLQTSNRLVNSIGDILNYLDYLQFLQLKLSAKSLL